MDRLRSNFWAVIFLIPVFLFLAGCKADTKPVEFTNGDISKVISTMTDIMVRDISNPPLAARFFSYSLLSGYEVISTQDKNLRNLAGLLNGYPDISIPDTMQSSQYQLAAILAMMETAGKMQPSGKLMLEYEKKFLDSCRKTGLSEDFIEQAKQYAEQVSSKILDYAKADGYRAISNLPRYTPSKAPGRWYPTPPGFIAAVEPYFNTIRPFTLDSAQQFKPDPPVAFNIEKGSRFYNLMDAVYKEKSSTNDSNKAIAAFWDCNPFIMNDKGHLMYAYKKISPGAHWMGITGIACKQANTSFSEAMRIYTFVAIGLMDGFMACWDEKFRSDRIRPETVIRQNIDPAWEPLLQTPPFPEYPSGHSTISAVAATVLTHYFGKNFSYTDTVELRFGLPARSFSSFQQASEEAAISRFYGGIHFMDAIENGVTQGKLVGEQVLKKVQAN